MFNSEKIYKESFDSKTVLFSYINTPSIFDSIAIDVFKVVDRNKNGEIEKDEFVDCMEQVAEGFGIERPNEKLINETFKKYDKDSNESIDFEEFKAYIKDILNKTLEIMV